MKDENDARAELTRKWAKFKPQDRNDCVAQGAAPMPSYVEILTCLEMSEEAGTLYNPDGTARANPSPAKQGLSSPAMTVPAGIPPAEPVPPAVASPSSPVPTPAPGSSQVLRQALKMFQAQTQLRPRKNCRSSGCLLPNEA